MGVIITCRYCQWEIRQGEDCLSVEDGHAHSGCQELFLNNPDFDPDPTLLDVGQFRKQLVEEIKKQLRGKSKPEHEPASHRLR